MTIDKTSYMTMEGFHCCAESWPLTPTSWEAHSLISDNHYEPDALQESEEVCHFWTFHIFRKHFIQAASKSNFSVECKVIHTRFVICDIIRTFRFTWQLCNNRKGTLCFRAGHEMVSVWKLTWFIGNIIWLPRPLKSHKRFSNLGRDGCLAVILCALGHLKISVTTKQLREKYRKLGKLGFSLCLRVIRKGSS